MRRVLAAVLSLCLLLPVSALAAGGGSYSDVPEGDWAAGPIRKATEYGLIQGKGDGTFGYGEPMTRGSFVTALCRLFGWEAVTPAAPSFSDVGPDKWYYSSVETALKNGAIEPGLYFRPEDDVSREDMAVMLVRALDYDQLAQSQAKADLPFPDVTDHRGYIALAWRFGIVSGVKQADGAYFYPSRSSTRQEAAAMLVRVYDKLHAKLDWLHGFYAQGSYGQISYTEKMDAVSLGWSRISVDPDKGPYLNQSSQSGNEWSVPESPELATGYFQGNDTPYHLSVYASASDLLTYAGSSTSSAAAALSDEARSKTVSAIVSAAVDYGGVTLDFENLRAPLKSDFTAFVAALRAALPADKGLFVCVQPPDWYDGYDYRALGETADKVILMAHDYQDRSLPASYVGTANTDNPTAPIGKVYSALAAVTDPDTGVKDPSKVALAVSFSSAGLKVDENGRMLSTTVYAPAPATLIGRLRQSGTERGWSDTYRSPYATYVGDDGARYRVWYEDARSVAEKVALAHLFGVDGVSLWRVGIIPDYPDAGLDYDVWAALQALR